MPYAVASSSARYSSPRVVPSVSPTMTRYDVNLGSFAGEVIQVRFRFSSDQLVDATAAGAWVDNVTTNNVIVSVPSVPCP